MTTGAPTALPEGARSHIAIKPSIEQEDVNSPIPLYSGNLEFTLNGVTTSEDYEIAFLFQSEPTVLARIINPTVHAIKLGGDMLLRDNRWDGNVGFEFESSSVDITKSNNQGAVYGHVSDPITEGMTERLGRVRFHLVNFRSYLGEPIKQVPQGGRDLWWSGRVRFELGPWNVTIDSVPDLRERINKAHKVGGYVITHVGNIERSKKDKGISPLFSWKDASKALDVLNLVFNFANGALCPCLLPFGYRHMDSFVARCSKAMRIASSYPADTWFKFADRLYKQWNDKNQRGWIHYAIMLYAQSNRNLSGADIELSKSQITLELLAYQICQEQQQLVSRQAFEERLSASDRIRISLLWAGIPVTIPPAMKELSACLKEVTETNSEPLDGPFIITYIRNVTVHGNAKRRQALSALHPYILGQAWQLSQSYVELLILRLLGYSGSYSPRFEADFRGGDPRWERTAPVPWAHSIM